MPAGWLVAPGRGGEAFDDPAFPPSAPADTEPSPDAVAGCDRGQEDPLPFVFGDAVSARPQPLDLELDEIADFSHSAFRCSRSKTPVSATDQSSIEHKRSV